MTKREIASSFSDNRTITQSNPNLGDPEVEGWFRAPSSVTGPPMIQDLEQIDYRRGILDKGLKPKDLPVKVWRGSRIPVDVRGAIRAENLLDPGGVYGDNKAGDPMGFDNLRPGMTNDTVEITVFNREIALFHSDDERVRRIHRVLCKLDDSGGN